MEQMTLFENNRSMTPLASRVRPDSLEEFVGQEHLLGRGKILRQLIEQDHISSMIFWGPPGVGKTTLASIIAGRTQSEFINFSAVTSGIKEIKEVMNNTNFKNVDNVDWTNVWSKKSSPENLRRQSSVTGATSLI